jgi:hypothetical protein
MNRLIAIVLLAIAMADVGCGEKQDRVVATFIFPHYTTTRIVLHSSGKYEQWLVADGVPGAPYKRSREYRITLRGIEVRERRSPIETGTYLRSTENIAISLKPDVRHSADWPAQRLYHIILYDGLEYLFDERGGWAQRFEESNDTNLLRYAWRPERR